MLGLAFKGGTDDVRTSPALALVRRFLEAGATVVGHDELANASAREVEPGLLTVDDPYAAVEGAHCVVIGTESPAYAALDLERIRAAMAYPIVVDGRNVLDPDAAAISRADVPAGRPAIAADLDRERLSSAMPSDPGAIRILEIITRMNIGGAARHIRTLLPLLRERGLAPVLMTGVVDDGEEELPLEDEEIPVIRNPWLRRRIDPVADLRAANKIRRTIAWIRPHVVHTQLSKAGALGRRSGLGGRGPRDRPLLPRARARGVLRDARQSALRLPGAPRRAADGRAGRDLRRRPRRSPRARDRGA